MNVYGVCIGAGVERGKGRGGGKEEGKKENGGPEPKLKTIPGSPL